MVSPYTQLKNWLLSDNISELDEDIIKSVNPRSVLGMFCTMGEVTIFLNDVFNNFFVMTRDFKNMTNSHRDFFNTLKELAQSRKLRFDEFSFIGSKRKDFNALHKEFPLLKTHELDIMIGSFSKEELKIFNQTISDKSPRKRKLTKKEIKEMEKIHNKPVEDDVISFKEWKDKLTGGLKKV